jgi:hypothetical protein
MIFFGIPLIDNISAGYTIVFLKANKIRREARKRMIFFKK